jgi:hypothetical protein
MWTQLSFGIPLRLGALNLKRKRRELLVVAKEVVVCCVGSKSLNQTLLEYNCALSICSEILRICNCLSKYKYILQDNGLQKKRKALVSQPYS